MFVVVTKICCSFPSIPVFRVPLPTITTLPCPVDPLRKNPVLRYFVRCQDPNRAIHVSGTPPPTWFLSTLPSLPCPIPLRNLGPGIRTRRLLPPPGEKIGRVGTTKPYIFLIPSRCPIPAVDPWAADRFLSLFSRPFPHLDARDGSSRLLVLDFLSISLSLSRRTLSTSPLPVPEARD